MVDRRAGTFQKPLSLSDSSDFPHSKRLSIGGASGTSLVLAGHYFDILYVGTMAHKFVSERPTELEAFRNYATTFPNDTTLLIDTYNTFQGAKSVLREGIS